MPFDPTLPLASSPVSSAELRSQLNALKALIDLCNVGIADLDVRLTSQELGLANVQVQLPTFLTQVDVEPMTANNIDGVTELSLTISNPPTKSEVEQILTRLNETITGLHR